MLEVTQEKLKEAAFFLTRVSTAAETMVGEEAKAFPYYLSAFLSASRSVTFAFQAEEKKKYDAWFPVWLERQDDEARDVLDFMKGQRNQVLKRGRADVAHSLEFVPLMKASPAQRRQALAFQWFGPPGVPPPVIPKRVRRFNLNGTPSDVVQTCVQYHRLLENMVAEFLRNHDSAA